MHSGIIVGVVVCKIFQTYTHSFHEELLTFCRLLVITLAFEFRLFPDFQVLSSKVFVPERSASGPFVFSVDHCFPIRGQGTVMTGTVLSGSVSLNNVSTHNMCVLYHIHTYVPI